MTEYAPQALRDLFDAIQAKIPQAQLGGILGDSLHGYGYHRARAVLPATDYSVELAQDRVGDGWAASALDVTLPPDLMIACTTRLLAAAKAKDQRLAGVREFCGTTNGTVTHNYDLSNGYEGFGEWDDSHLWHVHISTYRMYANDAAVLLPIADVFAGAGTATTTSTQQRRGDGMAVAFHRYTKAKNKDAVYLVTLVDGVGVAQQWMSKAELADRQTRAKAAGNKNTDVQVVSGHTRDYYGPVIGKDPEATT